MIGQNITIEDLVNREREVALRFVEGVVSSSFTIRGWAVTGWGALLGLAFQQHSRALALLAVGAVVAFGLVDAYHSWLYAEAVRYLRQIEHLNELMWKSAVRGGDDVKTDLAIELRVFKPGVLSNIARFRLRKLRSARPAFFFRVFYPTLCAVAIGAVFTIGNEPKADDCSHAKPVASMSSCTQPLERR